MTTLALVGAALLLLAEPHATAARRGPNGALAAAADLVRDDDVQAKIRAVANATSEDQLASALTSLQRAVAPDYSDLVPQLALFLLAAQGERAGMTPALIVSRLGISPGQILRAVESHLGTSDEALREQLENLLGAVDFGEIRALLAERGTPPSDALARYMFERSPADAVAVVTATADGDAASASTVRLVERTRVALASGSASEEERTRAAAALDELSRHPDWWLRAYAAAVVGDQPRLAGAGLRERLADDPEPRVRAVARAAAAATAR